MIYMELFKIFKFTSFLVFSTVYSFDKTDAKKQKKKKQFDK